MRDRAWLSAVAERLLVACEGAIIFGGGLCLFACVYALVVGVLWHAGLVP